MQNAGQQYGQGGASSHPGAPYGQTESSSNSGSITSSLRQFRKKDVEKQQLNDTNNTPSAESHVARVAPHNHYPPRPTECYRYPSQFQDYSLPSQVKYSEISDPQHAQEHLPPTVIQKAKGKDYVDMCNIQQTHMKQPYTDHLSGQQSYPPETNIHAHAQYLPKDPQIHAPYKPESQYFPKEPQYQQLPQHQIQKYNMPAQMRKCPTENDFLSKLRRIHPTMARSIMSDHHLQESQPSYQSMDQNRMYHHQNQRYMNYPASMQGNPYPSSYMPPQHYSNYPSSCSYTRPPQMGPRFPSMNNHERSLSPRRGYTDALSIPPINYTAQKIPPNYPQYNSPEYAQHYQHRRPALPPQEYYQQHCRTTQYLQHQMPAQEMSENRVTVSDNIKQYIENWADEETALEMNQMETNRLCKENFRVRDDQSTETVYMINASELQYLENGIPLVASENGIPLVTSENGQYIIKSGVAIDNSTGMVRIVDKNNHLQPAESTVDRVVNLHIMDPLKPDCMLASKSNEPNQKQNDSVYDTEVKTKVVIHQNTVIQPGQQHKEPDEAAIETSQIHNKIGNSLPLITDSDTNILEKFDETIFKECKKVTVDKNCSPINVEQMEKLEEYQDDRCHATVICPTKQLGRTDKEEPSENSNELKLKNMPIIDMLAEEDMVEKHKCESKQPASNTAPESNSEVKANLASDEENIHKSSLSDEERKSADVDHSSDDDKNNVGTADDEKIITDCNNVGTIENNDIDTNKNENGDIGTSIREETEEKSIIEDELLQTTKDSAREFEKGDEFSKNKAQEPQIKNVPAAEVVQDKEEKTGAPAKASDPDRKNESNDALTNRDMTVMNDDDNGKYCGSITITDNINSEKSARNSNLDNSTTSASENIGKATIKRSKRIFSVDDIINTIGTKSKVEKERAERRRSLQMTREFLEKEIDHSYTFLQKLEAKEIEIKEYRALNEEEESKKILENQENMDVDDERVTEQANKSGAEEIASLKLGTEVGESNGKSSVVKSATGDAEESVVEDRTPSKPEESDSNESSTKVISKELIPSKNSSEVVSELAIPSNINEESTLDISGIETSSVLSFKETEVEVVAQNEVHYRNAIRIEENNVLLQIAGELVEISVNSVKGKKVITVVPLSESTTVDFNDNYELLEHIEVNDLIKTDLTAQVDPAMEITDVEEMIPQPDIIETTSEIIIGMDISLEEEIQLDLERPQVLCTKAAKKAYENDLQIPSITTSEDVNDNNKVESYSPNDKVSSSKEQNPKDKNDKKKPVKMHSSKTKDDVIVKRPKCRPDKESDPDKKALRKLMQVRKLKKEKLQQKSVEEEEEFVPFKDLVKARKLKKLKLQQSKGSENVSADSTNKVDQEGNIEPTNDSKSKKDTEENVKSIMLTENNDVGVKSRTQKPKTAAIKPPKTETGKNGIHETHDKDEVNDNKKPNNKTKDNIVNIATVEKRDVTDKIKEKGANKKVTFGRVNYCEQQTSEVPRTEVGHFLPQDPRIRSKPKGDVIVPSVSEILKENERLDNNKKKLSLEEYNKRKRKMSVNSDGGDRAAKFIKIASENNVFDSELISGKTSEHSKARQADQVRSVQEKADRIKMPRPKSLDDIKVPDKPKDNILTKRKLSLEINGYAPNYLDWEETQSPKTNLNSHENNDRGLREFSGLINNNKSKIVIDINDLNVKPAPSDNSEDEILQNYKEQVDSKLSSLNIQIPRAANKVPGGGAFGPFSKPEANSLMQRFLQNEKISYEEMEYIKKIISYKRLVQQLKKIKSPDLANSPLSPSYEIRRNCAEKEMKLHLKKVPGKKSRQRFRNLYSASTTESDSDFSDAKKNDGDYSVVQSNSFAAGVPKLIIKRKTEMPVPVVRLERLDLGLLINKKRKVY